MERIVFDTSNRPEMPSLILMKKSGDKIGLITNYTGFRIHSYMNEINEISFTLHKFDNQEKYRYWEEVKDLRVIYAPEWKQYFEISVSLDDNNDVIKNVSGRALQESELSHINIYDVEINTESDILREDYEVTVLYNPDNPKGSLLHRLLSDKATHYKILHVDDSIASIQRTFSFDDISIYDAFMEITEEIHCLFVFGEDSDQPFMRTISVYDLESSCNDCNYRGEFDTYCPKCNSTNISTGYGDDSTIFITKENLGDEINISSDIDSVYNCFRLEAGDELMTATIINCTPSSSQYMWYFTDEMKADMSTRLRDKLQQYDIQYSYYQNEYIANIDNNIIEQYNQLIAKYKTYNDSLQEIITPIKGYSSLINLYYDVIDFYGYLYNSLLPSVETEDTSAGQQAQLLTAENLSPVAVQNADYISLATANSTLVAYAKVIIDSARYKIKVKNSKIEGVVWTGNFTVESYSDKEDVAESDTISVTFNDNYEEFLKQQIEKTLAKANDEDFSIIGLFALDNELFTEELHKYSYTHLQIIADACQSCLDILLEQGVADDDSWDYTEGDVYEDVYVPLYEKMELINQELVLRESEISIINGKTDEYGDVSVKGIRNYIDEIRSNILNALDFQTFIGDDWAELSSFRRESTWTNSNYISDGLSNKELFEKANQFLEAASKDIYKAATLQNSISSTLKNLLVLKEFEPLLQYFKTGNWMRIEIDGQIFKLRLIGYEIDYDELNYITVEFSDAKRKNGALSDIESILSQSKSIAKTYSSTKRQAKQGSDSKQLVDNWVDNGLNTTNTKIVESDNQQLVYDRHGLLFRQFDEINGTYSPLQIKIINKTLAMTNDNWKTSKVGLGEFEFFNPKTQQKETGYGLIADQVVGGLMLSEEIGIYNESGTMTFDDENGLNITNGINTFTVNPNNESLLSIRKGNVPVFVVSDTGELTFTGNVIANELVLGTNGLYETNGTTSISISPSDISILTLQHGTEKVLFFDDSGELNIKGKIEASSLVLGKDITIDVDQITGMDAYVRKDVTIGNISGSTTNGFSLASSGLLKTNGSILYNVELYPDSGSIAGFDVSTSLLSHQSSDNLFSGLSARDNNPLLFAGANDKNGSNATFQLFSNGKCIVNDTLFEIHDINQNTVMGFDGQRPFILDAWNNTANIVTSSKDDQIKLVWNNDVLEVWIQQELIAQLPKGFVGTII